MNKSDYHQQRKPKMFPGSLNTINNSNDNTILYPRILEARIHKRYNKPKSKQQARRELRRLYKQSGLVNHL